MSGLARSECACEDLTVSRTSGQDTVGIPGVVRPKCASADLSKAVWGAVENKSKGLMAPARLRPSQTGGNTCGCSLQVDRVLRLAIGIENDEVDKTKVRLHPIEEYRRAKWSREPKKSVFPPRWFVRLREWILPTVNVLAEVHAAELTLAEQNAVILEDLTIDALGMKSGDEFVLTSATGMCGPVQLRRKAVKGYLETELIRLRRHGQESAKQTPTERVAAESKSRHPRVWMGEAIRAQLGVDSVQDVTAGRNNRGSTVVLVSPSRFFVLMENMREVAFGLFLAAAATAAVAILSIPLSIDEVDTSANTVGSLPFVAGVLLLLAVLLQLWRLRVKLR